VLFTTGELVQEEPIRVLTDGVALALVRDPTRSLPWLVTTTALYQVGFFAAIVCSSVCEGSAVSLVRFTAVATELFRILYLLYCFMLFCCDVAALSGDAAAVLLRWYF
jgi:hypothetical protein